MSDLTQAKKLIKECRDTQNPYLDLGKCGITDLEALPELFECEHLETLILSNFWWDLNDKKRFESSNNGKDNKLSSIPKRISSLKKITKLIIGGNFETPWEISNLSFLEKLSELEYLYLAYNRITNIQFLKNLTRLRTLVLSDNQISNIRFLENLTELQSLDLRYNQISDLRFLENLTELQSLDLSHNQISELRFLEKLTGLQTLDLRFNQISDLRFLEKLTGLQTLDLRFNQISDLRFLEKLTGLQTLNLRNNQISDLRFLEKLTGLQTLDLRYNQISDLRFLEKLTGLQTLNLRNNQITDCSFLEKLTALQTLDLSSNQITDCSFLEKLTALQRLDLSSNQITDCSFLEKLTGLQTLYLGNNQITDYSFLEKLTALQTLDLWNNEISDIRFLEKLTGLQTLYLGSNQITDYSFLEKLTALQRLDLSSNQITDCSFLEKLTALQTLDLSSNQITDCSFLEKLTALQTLDLSSNQITDCSFLEKLTGLQSLDLSDNQISELRFLENLTKLQYLNLGSCNLKSIPLSIFQLNMEINMDEYGGEGLCLNDNPELKEPPLEIVKQGKQSVLDWFEATKKKLNEIKIILIGEPKAGKTSLLKRLKFDTFNKEEVQTDGINIEDIEFGECHTFKAQESLHKITGHFWDFGGQEIMNATHRFFLTKRSVYVLVLDARKDANNEAQIRNWVKRVKATGGDSPIIVVANQIDVNPGFGFENERELQNEFPQIKCFLKLSCSEGTNMDLFKEKLAELIPAAELFNTEIDERWIKIKERLQEETKEKYFLNEAHFWEICNEHQLNKKQGQKNAITFLHDLGLVLHFEDLKLQEYYVLDPYWITYGVYQILTSVHAGTMKGVVGMDQLEFIVNEEEDKKGSYNPVNYKKITYSTNERDFLIRILHQFKLCFCTPDHSQFIVPDLLDTAEPLDSTEPVRSSSEKIEFVYEYDYLPKSIMPNIMVETHHIMTKKWRTGCVLCRDGCKALVTNYRNRISITVTGEYKKKREFMAIIRFGIDSINQKLGNKPVCLIPLPGMNNEFADYERLLAREKKGKSDYIFDEDKPTEKSIPISDLLDGIPSEKEVRISGSEFKELKDGINDLKNDHKEIKCDLNDIKNKLDLHYNYLISLPCNGKIKNEIEETIKELNTQQTDKITGELTATLIAIFREFDKEIDAKLKGIYNDLKKTDNLQTKLKLSIPLINLLGIDLGVEFDIKSWATKMYKKYELQLFKLMGMV